MYHAPGIGLAGPQVGKSQRIFVLDVHYERKLIVHPNGDEHYEFQNLCPQIFINPKITNLKGKTTYQEGCLSVPGIYEDVVRFETCQVEYQDFHGETHSIHADGLLSICIQHENDHLNGIVFIERLSQLKKRFFKTKLLKEKKRLPL